MKSRGDALRMFTEFLREFSQSFSAKSLGENKLSARNPA